MHFFDLLKTYNLDLTDYLKSQDIKFDYYQSVITEFPELCNLRNWKSVIQDDWLIDYIVPQNTRIDMISYSLYKNPDFWWTILLVNGMNNPFDWILSDEEIMELADLLYIEYNEYPLKTYQELLFDYYDNKRNIKVIDPGYLPNFLIALKEKAK